MSSSMRRDLAAGAAAGLIGGLAFAWAMQAQGLRAAAGLAGLSSTGTGVALEILAAILIGAGYGAIFRYQPFAYAATISSGVLYGLLWWIAGPLTLAPLLLGRGPGWSLQEADAALPSLVGHVLYGALTGLSFYALVSLYRRGGARAGGGAGAHPARRHPGGRLRRREHGAAPGAALRPRPAPGDRPGQPEQLSPLHTHARRGCQQRPGGAAHQCARTRRLPAHPVCQGGGGGGGYRRAGGARPRQSLRPGGDAALRSPGAGAGRGAELLRPARPGGARVHAEDAGRRHPPAESRHRSAGARGRGTKRGRAPAHAHLRRRRRRLCGYGDDRRTPRPRARGPALLSQHPGTRTAFRPRPFR